jgi:hypothetical protein
MYLRLVWVFLLISLAAAGGYVVADLSVRDEVPPPIAERMGLSPRTAAGGLTGDGATRRNLDAPVWFFARPTPQGDWSSTLEQIKLAAKNRVHRCAVSISLPWNGAEGVDNCLATLERILSVNPDARILLDLNLNPPSAWQRTHGEDVVQVNGELHAYPSMGSRIWLRGVQSALVSLIDGLQNSPAGEHVEGFILSALENGRWYRSGGYDGSPANREGFRAWLGRLYGDDPALQDAWGNTKITFDTVEVPEMPATNDPLQVFFTAPGDQQQIDYLRYVSESTADNIGAITAHIKGHLKTDPLVFAQYGHSLELTENASGHFALHSLLDSDLDGFVSPVSYVDRGLGGNGSVMGPVHSVLAHGKMWIVVDDTRTGLELNDAGIVERYTGIQPAEVKNFQLRNFGAAMAQGLGIGWMDPEGKGWLLDAGQWEFLGHLFEVYAQCIADGTIPPVVPANSLEAPPEQEEGAEPDIAAEPPLTAQEPTLAVVFDESSRFYLQAGAALNSRLLHQVRDAALRSGLPVRFVLFRDVLDKKVPDASVYIFANLFHLTEADRVALHAHLASIHAAAIWMYAPGYFAETASVQNISETVQMNVRSFQKKRTGGSRFLLAGAWAKEDEQIGQEQEWDPLFYISDESVDVIAEYLASDEASVAMRFMDDWTSIYVAEPAMTPGLLREMLEFLEQHVYFRTTAQTTFDTLYLGNDILVLHAGKAGDRVLDFGRYCDVLDLHNPDYGWKQKYNFDLNMNAGETRVLRLFPLEP